MASMTRHERALYYAQRLKSSQDIFKEAAKIKKEIDSLIWSKDKTPLPLKEKLAILNEVKRIIIHGERSKEGLLLIEAGDNSGILDVIDSIENELKQGT